MGNVSRHFHRPITHASPLAHMAGGRENPSSNMATCPGLKKNMYWPCRPKELVARSGQRSNWLHQLLLGFQFLPCPKGLEPCAEEAFQPLLKEVTVLQLNSESSRHSKRLQQAGARDWCQVESAVTEEHPFLALGRTLLALELSPATLATLGQGPRYHLQGG